MQLETPALLLLINSLSDEFDEFDKFDKFEFVGGISARVIKTSLPNRKDSAPGLPLSTSEISMIDGKMVDLIQGDSGSSVTIVMLPGRKQNTSEKHTEWFPDY